MTVSGPNRTSVGLLLEYSSAGAGGGLATTRNGPIVFQTKTLTFRRASNFLGQPCKWAPGLGFELCSPYCHKLNSMDFI